MADLQVIIVLAFIIEALIQAVKPVWNPTTKKLSVTELIAMGVGIILAIGAKLNVFEYVYPLEGWAYYVGSVLTGVIIGRGSSFVFNLMEKIKQYVALPGTYLEAGKVVDEVDKVVDRIDE